MCRTDALYRAELEESLSKGNRAECSPKYLFLKNYDSEGCKVRIEYFGEVRTMEKYEALRASIMKEGTTKLTASIVNWHRFLWMIKRTS